MQERIGVVANIHSLFHGSKRVLGGPVAYQRLMSEITKGRRLVQASACAIGSERHQEKFLGALRAIGFTPIVCPVEEAVSDTFVSEMIRMAGLVDTLVLLTGQNAILPILDYLNDTDRTPKIELWYFEGAIPDDLAHGVDTVNFITKNHIYQQNPTTDG